MREVILDDVVEKHTNYNLVHPVFLLLQFPHDYASYYIFLHERFYSQTNLFQLIYFNVFLFII